MTFQERIQWIARIALMLFILASAAFLSAITAMRIAVQGREVVMPDVVGKRLPDAQSLLQGRGLGIRIEDRAYNALPADSIIRQSPPANMRVKVGQYSHVVLSLGPQAAKIPSLVMKSARADRIELLRSGLEVGEVSSSYFPDEPTDTVMLQDPPPGAGNASTSHVNMLVSEGARPIAYVMPDLEGIALTEAELRISSSGLKIGKVTFTLDTNAPHGSIAAQSPSHGTRVDITTPIDLQIAE
jgi:eukaryotic-like serine/threonine-protein kinase